MKRSLQAEQFDLNSVELEGMVQRIWEYDGAVFFRLAVFDRFRIDNDRRPYQGFTCRFPDNNQGEELVSLMPGDRLRVIGHLADAPYIETLRQFLQDAKAVDFFAALPNSASWSAVQVPRVSTLIEVREIIPMQIVKGSCYNRTMVQGIITKVWERGGNLLARLAVYDAYTKTAPQDGKHDWPRRTPHYITILFIDGKVGEKPVHLSVKNRLRVIGTLTTRYYRESLREVLLRSQNLSLLDNLPNSDRAGDISAAREATYVVAQSAIIFASMSPLGKESLASSQPMLQPMV